MEKFLQSDSVVADNVMAPVNILKAWQQNSLIKSGLRPLLKPAGLNYLDFLLLLLLEKHRKAVCPSELAFELICLQRTVYYALERLAKRQMVGFITEFVLDKRMTFVLIRPAGVALLRELEARLAGLKPRGRAPSAPALWYRQKLAREYSVRQ